MEGSGQYGSGAECSSGAYRTQVMVWLVVSTPAQACHTRVGTLVHGRVELSGMAHKQTAMVMLINRSFCLQACWPW